MSDQTDGNDDVTEDDDVEVVDLTLLSEGELRERHGLLGELIEELRAQPRTIEVVATINALREERNEIVQAVRDLTTLDSAEIEDLSIDSADPVEGESATTEATEAEEPTTQTEAEAPTLAVVAEDTNAPQEDPVSDQNEIMEAADEVVAEALVASAGERPVAPAAQTHERVRVAYVAGAGQNAFTQGVDLDMAGLARAWDSKRHIQPAGDAPVSAVVASLPAFEDTPGLPVEVLTHRNTAEQNDAIVAAAVAEWREARSGGPLARTAAICSPLDIIREIPEVGTDETPFASAFPSRPVGRLGFQFTQPASIASTNGAITVWTESNQNSVDPDDSATWKPCVNIACSSPTEVKAEELVTCATVDSSTQMSSPERVAEFMHLLGVQRSRRREQYLLGKFDATASAYTFAGTYGALPSLIQAVATLLPQLLYVEREDVANYDLVLEPGHFAKLSYDETNKAYTDPADVKAALASALGLNVIVLRDFKAASPFQTPPTPGGASATLAEIPDTNVVRIVPSGAYIYGSTGEESTGWQTDPQLARQNRQQAFSVEWLMLAKHGGSPAATISVTAVGNGSRACCTTAFGTGTYSGS